MTGLVLDLFCGVGVAVGLRALGLEEVGIDADPAVCATRRAVGLATVRADVARYPAGHLAGRVRGLWASPPCPVFSSAGNGHGRHVLDLLGAAAADQLAGRPTRAAHRERIARTLLAAVPHERTVKRRGRDGRRAGRRRPVTVPLTRAERQGIAWGQAHAACLSVQPARFVRAAAPAWVAMEQVPEVLPLWRAYAAELARQGYSVWAGVLDAANYGVPQNRRRAVLMASRERRVAPPEPTHQDPRRGGSLLGLAPWVSMAQALGWDGVLDPLINSTVGGGEVERYYRDTDRPSPVVRSNADRWKVRSSYGQPKDDPRNGGHEFDPHDRPAHTVTGKAKDWTLRTGNHDRAFDRSVPRPPSERVPHLDGGSWFAQWAWERPAPTVVGTRRSGDGAIVGRQLPEGAGREVGGWRWRSNTQAHAAVRDLDPPASTIFAGGRVNDISWVRERPATTVQGAPRAPRPGHRDREGGEHQQDGAVRVTLEELAVLQGFDPALPFQGNKMQRAQQVGNAVPPPLAAAIVAALTGADRPTT